MIRSLIVKPFSLFKDREAVKDKCYRINEKSYNIHTYG
jgi:hypothetical protein